MLRGRRPTARRPASRAARLAGRVLTPAAVLAAAGLGGPASAQIAPGSPHYQTAPAAQPSGGGWFGLQADEPPPAPAPTPAAAAPDAARAEALRQQRAYRQQAAMRQAATQRQAEMQRQARMDVMRSAPTGATQTAGPARVSILGAVRKPRTFEFERNAPTLDALVERAGGLTGASNRTVRIVRGGVLVGQIEYMPGTALPLAAGDVVVADAVPGTGPREPGHVLIAVLGLTDRPVVLQVAQGNANLPTLLPKFGLPVEAAPAVRVLSAGGGRNPLPDGAVLVLPPGASAETNWDEYGDLVKEEIAPPVTVADMAPAAPRRPAPAATSGPILRPGRRATNRPSGTLPLSSSSSSAAAVGGNLAIPAADPLAADPVAADPVVSGSSESLSLPAMPPRPTPPGPTAALPAVELPAPPTEIGEDANETIVADLYDTPLYDTPAADTFAPSPGDFPAGEELALLPAPGESPFYPTDSALAATDSHLIPLEDLPAMPPSLDVPSPTGDLPRMRVATLPAPGVRSDSPRATFGGSAPRPLADGGRPIPAESAPLRPGPVPPAADLPMDPPAPAAASGAKPAEAGVPWVTVGFVLGALLGGFAAAGVALRRRTAATIAAGPTEPAAKRATEPSISEAANRSRRRPDRRGGPAGVRRSPRRPPAADRGTGRPARGRRPAR